MCIRYDTANDQLVKWSQAVGSWVPLEDWLAGTDTYPGYEAPLIVLEERKKKQLTLGQWGLIPQWADKPTFGRSYGYNARSEGREGHNDGIQNTPAFRNAFKSRRCLIPVSGYYEQEHGYWQRITMTSEGIFAIAGIWEPPKFSRAPTYAMVTCEPNDLIATVQDRMPVVLRLDQYDDWMDMSASLSDLQELMQPLPSELFEIEQREPVAKKKERSSSATPSLFGDDED